MDYEVLIGEEAFQISISGRGGKLQVSRNGEPLPVDFEEVGPDSYSMIIDRKAYLVTSQRDARGLTVRLAGRAYAAAVSRADGDGPGIDDRGLHGDEGEVRSVMPGIVTRLLVEPGDPVEPGTPLLVLEAMKMENEVRSHRRGVVDEIHISEREAVDAGDILVTIV